MARKPEPPKRPSKITIPERANPLAKLVFAEMRAQGVTYDELEWRAGVLRCTIKAWRNENKPGLETIAACLGALGWALVPVPCRERVPPKIAAALAELAEEWGTEEELLHRLLASACNVPIMIDGSTVAPPTIDLAPERVTSHPRKAKAAHPEQVSLFQ